MHKPDTSPSKPSVFIVSLNKVDLLTLSGIIWSALAIGLIINEHFALAMSCLCIAMLTDAFDGILARKLGLERAFGRYLDGFVDAIDYLIAPALFLYLWGFNHPVYVICILSFVICGVIRLSVFNDIGNITDEDSKLSYLGMPVFWSLFIVAGNYLVSILVPASILPIFIIHMLLAVQLSAFSLAMVTRKRFKKFKSPKKIAQLVLGMAAVFAFIGLSEIAATTINFFLITPLLLIFPLVIAGSVHMAVVMKNHLSMLKVPISTSLFGANKTFRGLILMPLFAVFSCVLLYPLWPYTSIEQTVNLTFTEFVLIEAGLGLGYIIFELPNSFIKRRLGIPPGGTSATNPQLFKLIDQLDSTVGIAISALLLGLPLATAIMIFVLALPTAIIVKTILHRLGLKAVPR